MLQLSLAKDGVAPNKLSLNLAKPASFRVDMAWDTAGLDLDVHALLAINSGSGAKITSLGQVLSTYNCKKTNKVGTLSANPDGSFQTPEGALVHSPDEIAGGAGVDEFIIVNGAKVPDGVNEIPVFVTIDPQAYLVERIGGAHVDVSVLVGPGQCAETFEPSRSAISLVRLGPEPRSAMAPR